MIDVINRIYQTIVARKNANPQSSYVASLFARGNKKIAQKIGEEATEVVLASAGGDRKEIIHESADLVFHLMALWVTYGITPDEIGAELVRREGVPGLEEKAKRVKSDI